MVYTTPQKVRAITNNKLTVSIIDNDALAEVILQATAKINSIVNIYIREEEVRYIDEMRKNNAQDGTTTKFYVKNGITNYLSDMNNDGVVNTSDVKAYKLDKDNVRSELTITSIDIEDGAFTLSAAPGTDTKKLFVWYAFSYYNVYTPDKLIELLTSYLTASFAYLQKEHNLAASARFGNIEITRLQRRGDMADEMAYQRYYNRYLTLLKQITIPLNKPKNREYKHLI